MTLPEGFAYDPHNHRPVPHLSGPTDEWVRFQNAAIADGHRPKPRLGKVLEQDDGDGTYHLEYIPEAERDQWPNSPYGANPSIPATPEPYSADWWWPVYVPLIDRWESELMTFRFGKNRRRILKLIFNAPTGVAELFGPTLVPAIWEALVDFEKRDEPEMSDSDYKVLMTALKDLAHHGYIHVFTREPDRLPIDPDDEDMQRMYGTDRYGRLPTEWLIAPAGMLIEATPALMRNHRADFIAVHDAPVPTVPASDLDNRSEYHGEWPHIQSLDPTPRALGGIAGLNYAHRDSPRWTVPVVPIEERKPQQPVHVVMRGVPVGGEFRPQTGSVQQVSEIISTSPLRPYLRMDPTDGRHVAALEAIKGEGTKRRGAITKGGELEALLEFLTTDDQLAVLNFIRDGLDSNALRGLDKESFEGVGGVPLVMMAFFKISTDGGGRAHVMRQIVLLVGAILQDTVAAWSGQIVETWPKPDGPPPEED